MRGVARNAVRTASRSAVTWRHQSTQQFRSAASAPAVSSGAAGAALWQNIDVNDRERLATLARTAPEDATVLTSIRKSITEQPSAMAKSKDLKKLFREQKFKTVSDLVTFYEGMLQPVHKINQTVYDKWVVRCDYESKITQTKNASEEEMAGWKSEHKKLGDEMDALNEQKRTYALATFDTAIYNHVLSVLRLAAETNEGAHAMAVQVFHDMTELDIPFDDATKIMLRNVCFGDSYYENSDLLMSCVEYPERGEHTLGKDEDLTEVSSSILSVISQRHKIDTRAAGLLLQDKARLLDPIRDAPGAAQKAVAE